MGKVPRQIKGGRIPHRGLPAYSNNVSWQSSYFCDPPPDGKSPLRPPAPGGWGGRREILWGWRSHGTLTRCGGSVGRSSRTTTGNPPTDSLLGRGLHPPATGPVGTPSESPVAIPDNWATPAPPACDRCANRTAPLRGIGLIRFRSSLPAESRLISFPRPTEIFHFGTVLIELGFGVFTLGEPPALRARSPVPAFVSWFIRPF